MPKTRSLMKYVVVLFVMLGGCNADYHTKIWAHRNLRQGAQITLIKNFIDLGFTENRGMIFGVMNGEMPLVAAKALLGFRAAVLIGLTIAMWRLRKRSAVLLTALALFWAGAIGNLIDQIFRGYVVDFIHIRFGRILIWPFYFNLADAYITVGMVLVLMLPLFQRPQGAPKALD